MRPKKVLNLHKKKLAYQYTITAIMPAPDIRRSYQHTRFDMATHHPQPLNGTKLFHPSRRASLTSQPGPRPSWVRDQGTHSTRRSLPRDSSPRRRDSFFALTRSKSNTNLGSKNSLSSSRSYGSTGHMPSIIKDSGMLHRAAGEKKRVKVVTGTLDRHRSLESVQALSAQNLLKHDKALQEAEGRLTWGDFIRPCMLIYRLEIYIYLFLTYRF